MYPAYDGYPRNVGHVIEPFRLDAAAHTSDPVAEQMKALD